jgi:hypothetical protein
MGTVPSRSVALTGSRSSASPRRRRGHVLLGAMSWIVLAALWVWQLDVYVPSNWFGGVALIIILLAGWTCFSMMWVAWCRNIYRRRHRRTSAPEREVDFEHDQLGRRIVAPRRIAAERGQVLISVEEPGIKRYELAEPRPPTRALPAQRDGRHAMRPRQIA